MTEKRHVFISYSRKDSAILQRVKQSFDDAKIPHWTDEHIEPGTRSWRRAIEHAIREAGCLVCILSPDAAESHWVEQELAFAERLNVPVQLVLARGDEANAIPFGYATHQYVDIRTDYDAGMSRLLPILVRLFGSNPPAADPAPAPELVADPPPRIEVVTQTPVRAAVEAGRIPTLEEAPIDYSQIKPVTRNSDWTPVIRLINGIEMCLVPPGCFMMGSEAYENAQPVHQRCFDQPFWLGRYPVTNAQYAEAVKAGVCRPSSLADNERFNQPQQPVVKMNWHEAREFVEWKGMNLPTEAGWEYAARGPESRVWPWGNEFVADNLVYKGNSGGQTAVVGSRAGGAAWVGALDMSGNVWEWCLTKWRDSYTEREDNDPAGDVWRVLRGGSFSYSPYLSAASYRNLSAPSYRNRSCGLRVVLPAPVL